MGVFTAIGKRTILLGAMGLASLGNLPLAEAKRVVDLPVLKFSSFHGGSVSGVTCGAIGMLKAENYDGASGVKWAHHTWQVSFKNLSDTTQTVRLIALPGTQITNQNSEGALGITKGTTEHVARRLDSANTQTAVLGAYGSAEMGLTMISGSNVGYIAPVDSWDSNACGIQPEHSCMTASSTVILRIEVEEDRGAVLANVVSGGHRCYGLVDHFTTPPANFNVNGGRPF